MTRVHVLVVNADNYRTADGSHRAGQAQLAREIRGMGNPAWGVQVIAVVEALGNDLPKLPGYRIIRDTSTASRANLAAYVHESLTPTRVRWHDMKHGWRRVETAGEHEPRSLLTFRVGRPYGRLRVAVAHAPDPRAKGPAKGEYVRHLAAWLLRYPWLPAVVLWDSNWLSPLVLKVVHASQIGHKVDHLLIYRCTDAALRYKRVIPAPEPGGGLVPFQGDHGDFGLGWVDVPDKYLTNTTREKP